MHCYRFNANRKLFGSSLDGLVRHPPGHPMSFDFIFKRRAYSSLSMKKKNGTFRGYSDYLPRCCAFILEKRNRKPSRFSPTNSKLRPETLTWPGGALAHQGPGQRVRRRLFSGHLVCVTRPKTRPALHCRVKLNESRVFAPRKKE